MTAYDGWTTVAPSTGAIRGLMVLHVLSTVEDGAGMTTAAIQLAVATAARGVCAEVTGPLRHGENPCGRGFSQGQHLRVTPITQAGGPVRHLASAVAVCRRVAAFARAAAARQTAAVVHVHGVWMPVNIAASFASKWQRIAYVVSPHGMLLPEAMAKSRLRKRAVCATVVRRVLERAAAVHVTSEAERGAVVALAPRARTVLIPWGVAVPPRKAAHPLPERVAGFLGRMLPIKGVDLLIDAWAAVRPAGWRLRLVGSDAEGHGMVLQHRIERHGLRESITIERQLPSDQITDFLASIALFILPSRSENFGLVVAEALAAGTPVLTTTATPWGGLLEQGAGWVVPPTVAGLTEGLREAAGMSPQHLSAMGECGRNWVETSLSWNSLSQQFIQALYVSSGD